MTQEEKDALMKAHNDHRALHCSGALTWDAALAQKAQAFADTCPGAHAPVCDDGMDTVGYNEDPDDPHCRGANPQDIPLTVGENIAWGGTYGAIPGGGAAATDAWYSEYTEPQGRDPAKYDFEADGGTDGDPTGNDGTGHFTQVVWKATTKIGCGVKRECDVSATLGSWAASTTVWVCQYQMAGNWGFSGACSMGDELCFEKNVIDPLTCQDSDS